MERILITGALGQIGSDLYEKLIQLYGKEAVIATDVKPKPAGFEGIYAQLDVMDFGKLDTIIQTHQVNIVYHLASLLSATSEKNPKIAWDLNILPLLHILDLAKEEKIKKIFWPSSIAVFGYDTPKENTPQDAYKTPNTVYGITKIAGENWCQYYFDHYGVDVRSIRYPGLVSWKAAAGGGTTDYAVEVYYEALLHKVYRCFLSENTYLPMLYMEDAIDGTIALMQADKTAIKVRTSYNLSGMSFSPKEVALEIQKYIPDFKITYNPDFRQKMAASWPKSIDDSCARNDWNWNPKYDLGKMTTEMLAKLEHKLLKKL